MVVVENNLIRANSSRFKLIIRINDLNDHRPIKPIFNIAQNGKCVILIVLSLWLSY